MRGFYPTNNFTYACHLNERLCLIFKWSTTHLIDCSEMWRLQRDKRESRDPAGSVANEEARPRPRKASTCNGNQ